MLSPPPLTVIVGPTASGKSAQALAWAVAHNGVIINADSQQVYNALPLLTAQPDAQALAMAPHRLYATWPTPDICTAGSWAHAASTAVHEAWDAGMHPIIVGGTGFYLMALFKGLRAVPPIPEQCRLEAIALRDEIGLEAFYEVCHKLDPASTQRIAPADVHRLLRIWEVITATGKPLSQWHQETPHHVYVPANTPIHGYFLCPPREQLYEAINHRTRWMIHHGALEEVEAMGGLGLPGHHPLLKAVGVPELTAYVEGRVALHDATDLMAQRTRNYAKRQITWFRHQLKDIAWASFAERASVEKTGWHTPATT